MTWLNTQALRLPALIALLGIVLAIYSEAFYISSKTDLLFETSTIAVLTYIYLIIKDFLLDTPKIRYGFYLMFVSKIYDVLTEIEPVDEFFSRHALVDSLLEDGTLQVSYLLVAVGISQIAFRLKHTSFKDEMTGLYNRRKLAEIELEAFEIIYFDLDGLKVINDKQGHKAGDRYITHFAHTLDYCVNEQELAIRVGGDEFVTILELNRTEDFLQHLDKLLSGTDVKYSYGTISTTLENLDNALSASDKAMYEMKRSRSSSEA
ncbi:GGDEF domain-containing protein [Vibrio sp. SCSIO 43136]|uniref:GGDEF domain-containing protein n=1 Tax=Vibrio sp. SCSIO 43136 TaxID=2819101 RepID=UPI002076041E|nr:GGDEF domain-containing protein [Vibrio sp. SCSIO 43136]USD66562.1 GGDEF domain-containing protein [Vibrio sp. SCSIO 43136]